MSTGFLNGTGWSVIDCCRSQSACWESTVLSENRTEEESEEEPDPRVEDRIKEEKSIYSFKN